MVVYKFVCSRDMNATYSGSLQDVYTIKRNSVCVSVCFSSSETAKGTSIKLGTIDHFPVVSVTRGFVTSSWRHNQKTFFNLRYLTEDNYFLLKRKPGPDLPHYKNFCLWSK